MFNAIAQFLIMYFRPKHICLNKESYIEALVTKAVEYGYMLAMSQYYELHKEEKKYW